MLDGLFQQTEIRLFVLSFGGSLFSDTVPLLVSDFLLHVILGVELVHGGGHDGSLESSLDRGDGENVVLSILSVGSVGSGCGRVSPGDSLDSLLSTLGASGDDDKTVLVGLESLDISLEGLGGSILSSEINSDTNGSGEGRGETDRFEFLERESLSDSGLTSISGSARSDNRSEAFKRTGGNLGSLGSTSFESRSLTTGLVVESLDPSLPMLSKMDVRQDIVVFNHFVSV